MQRLQIIRNSLNAGQVLVELEVIEQIAVLSLNSPKDLNALSSEMKSQLCTHLLALDSNKNIKVIVLVSKVEKAFCAGANIKDFQTMTYETQLTLDIFTQISETLHNLKKPLIVGVNGVALGGGFEVALFADIIIAAEDARFGLPELKLGVIPGIGGTQRFPRLVGRTNAMRYILTGDLMTAQEAVNLGVVNIIVKKEQLRDECIKIAKKIQDRSLYTLMTAKQSIKNSEELPLTQGSRIEKTLFNSLLNTKAPMEGSTAFVDKRPANFKDI